MNLFQTKEYLTVFAQHFCRIEDVIDGIWEKYRDGLILLGMKPVLGGEEVTDFGHTDITDLPQGYKNIQLDYIREDCSTYARYKDKTVKVEVSPYIVLPGTWEDYLIGLPRKYRKELKRKFNRLNEVKHEFVTENNLAEFFRLHRLSDPHKNKFMSQKMADFFTAVVNARIPDWETRLDFLKIDGQYAAGIISFVSSTEVWLYNSGYDPQYAYYSPGLLLKAQSIKRAIESGRKRYDFLRGKERYKYDLGAKDRQLYRIDIRQ